MNDTVLDRVVTGKLPGEGEQLVLWEPVAPPPPWWACPANFQPALDAYVAEFGLPEERGAHIDYQRERAGRVPPAGPAVPTEPPPPPPEPRDLSPVTEELLRQIAPDLPPEVAAGIARTHADAEYPDPQPAADPKAARWAWVDRDGRAWPARGYMDHAALAAALAAKLGIDLSRWAGDADKALQAMNWVKLGADASGSPWAYCERPNETQVRAVLEWLPHQGADADAIREWVAKLD